VKDADPATWLPATLVARGPGKPGETYRDPIEQRLWRWDEAIRKWVTEDQPGRTGRVIMTGGRRAMEDAKTVEVIAEPPAEAIEGTKNDR
jgi:hypothetical protein